MVGAAGLVDRASSPHRKPTAISDQMVTRIEELRRTRKCSARRIAGELTAQGHTVSVATASHHVGQLKKASMASATRRGMNVYYLVQRDALQAQRLVLDPHCC